MESFECRVTYKQGFKASKPVVDILNSFTRIQKTGFVLFSAFEFGYTTSEMPSYDSDESESAISKSREINERITELRTYSRNLAIKTIHLSLPAGGTQDERGMLLRFSPFAEEAASYWKIIEKLYSNENTAYTSAQIVKLTQKSIHIRIPAAVLRPHADIQLAKQGLAHAFNDPDQKYTLVIENVLDLTKSDSSETARVKQLINHPDILNEDAV